MHPQSNPTSRSPLPQELGAHTLVRVGRHGQIGKFRCSEPLRLQRGSRVVCRTARGIEVGEVLNLLGPSIPEEKVPEEKVPEETATEETEQLVADGTVLRLMSPEDELLWGHLRQLGEQAHVACERWLGKQDQPFVLLEVEPLLDGKTLYFHFLSEIDPCVQEHLDQLVEIYEHEVSESPFAHLLEQGCGPGCGTADAKNGCGTKGGCAVCKIATVCNR